MLLRNFFILFFVLIGGCAQNVRPPMNMNMDQPLINCHTALSELNQLAGQHTGTLIGEKIDHTPWLRSNRLLEHFMDDPELSDVQTLALLQRMSSLATEGLTIESGNLPAALLQAWQDRYSIEDTNSYITQCQKALTAASATHLHATKHWLQQLPKDDDYRELARIAGIYPLTALAFHLGVRNEHQHIQSLWKKENHREWISYIPKPAPSSPTPVKMTDIAMDALGLPQLTPSQQQNLLHLHAPNWLIATDDESNRPVHPHWQDGQLKTIAQPSSFNYVTLGRFNHQTTIQLNYMIWFTERPPLKKLDLLAGEHDAIIFRIHMTIEGDTLAYDSIHLCGCWYSLILSKNQPVAPEKGPYTEPLMVFRTDFNNPVALYLQPNTHLLINVEQFSKTKPEEQREYQQITFQQLYQLPAGDSFRSVFDKQGFVTGSERAERWLYWPMGVRNPGALRRPGDHAIRFIGKLHFDDPLILEKLGVGKPL